MKKVTIDYVVPPKREDMWKELKAIIDSCFPLSEKGKVVRLIVTMEYNKQKTAQTTREKSA